MKTHHKITYNFLTFFAHWLSLFSDRSRNRLAIGIASILFNWITLRQNIARRNLKRAFPEKSDAWREKTLRQSYQFFTRLMLLFFTMPKNYPKLRVNTVNKNYLDDALAQDKGVIMISGHFGAWEVYAAWTGYNGYPVVPVAVRQRNRGANRFFTELRGDAGIEPIYRKDSIASMYHALEDGKILTLGSDQDARRRGVFVDFFGYQSSTPKGAARFHLKSKAPMVFGICHENDGEYYLEFQKVDAGPDDDVKSITQKYTSMLEEKVRQYPEQYFWWHRRWKTKPPGTE